MTTVYHKCLDISTYNFQKCKKFRNFINMIEICAYIKYTSSVLEGQMRIGG